MRPQLIEIKFGVEKDYTTLNKVTFKYIKS